MTDCQAFCNVRIISVAVKEKIELLLAALKNGIQYLDSNKNNDTIYSMCGALVSYVM